MMPLFPPVHRDAENKHQRYADKECHKTQICSDLIKLAFQTRQFFVNGIDAPFQLIRAVGKVVEPFMVYIFRAFAVAHPVTLSVALLPNKEGAS